jgi:CO/xanthine dehydrogenase Mo-binding subunit
MPGGQEGPLHVYMMQALADVLGLDAAELEARIESGETPYSIAIAQGKSAEEIPALFASARSKALDLAVEAGAITQAQVDWMKSRGNGQGRGMGIGTCDGTGNSQMHGGWRWQQTTP